MILEKEIDALWQLIGLHAVCWNKRRASILNEGNRGATCYLCTETSPWRRWC